MKKVVTVCPSSVQLTLSSPDIIIIIKSCQLSLSSYKVGIGSKNHYYWTTILHTAIWLGRDLGANFEINKRVFWLLKNIEVICRLDRCCTALRFGRRPAQSAIDLFVENQRWKKAGLNLCYKKHFWNSI